MKRRNTRNSSTLNLGNLTDVKVELDDEPSTTSFNTPFASSQDSVCYICLQNILARRSREVTVTDIYLSRENFKTEHGLDEIRREECSDVDLPEKDLYRRFSNFCIQYLKVDPTSVRFLEDAEKESVEIPQQLFCRNCKELVRCALKIYAEWNELKVKLLGTVNQLGVITSQSYNQRDCTAIIINDDVRSFREQFENNCFTKAQIIQPVIQLASAEIIEQPEAASLSSSIINHDKLNDKHLIQQYNTKITSRKRRNQPERSQAIPDDNDDNDNEHYLSYDSQDDDTWSPSPPATKKTRLTNRNRSSKTGIKNRTRRIVKRKILPGKRIASSSSSKRIESEKVSEGKGIRKLPRSPYLYNCSECKMKFKRKALFIQHNLKVHEGIDLEKYLECSICQEKQEDVIVLQKHLKSEHDDDDCPEEEEEKRKFFCVHCTVSTAFATAQLRDLHMLIDHSKCPHILCEVDQCREKFLSVADYCNHLLKYHTSSSSNDSIHYCEQCGRGFLSFQHCELHKLYHLKKNAEGFHICPIQECRENENKYKHADKLVNHYNQKHVAGPNRVQLHRCDLCKVSPCFIFRKDLSVHQRINHAKRFQCKFCGMFFLGQNALTVHQFNKHPNDCKGTLILSKRQSGLELAEEEPPPIIMDISQMEHGESSNITGDGNNNGELDLVLYRTCPYCTKKFVTFKEMEKHKATEHKIQTTAGIANNKQVQCEVCGATLAKARLARHMLNHKEPELACPYPSCPRRFRRKDNVLMHVKKCHDRKESEREFVCDTCGKRYLSAGILNRHVKEQHKKLYSCHLCPKKFNSTGKTIEHLWTFHTDEKFQCKWCPNEYTWLVKLKGHVKKKHPEEAHLLSTFYSYSSKPTTYKNIIEQTKEEVVEAAAESGVDEVV